MKNGQAAGAHSQAWACRERPYHKSRATGARWEPVRLKLPSNGSLNASLMTFLTKIWQSRNLILYNFTLKIVRTSNFVSELACRDAHGRPVGLDGRAGKVTGRPRAPVLGEKTFGLGFNGQFLNSIWTGRAGLRTCPRATALVITLHRPKSTTQ